MKEQLDNTQHYKNRHRTETKTLCFGSLSCWNVTLFFIFSHITEVCRFCVRVPCTLDNRFMMITFEHEFKCDLVHSESAVTNSIIKVCAHLCIKVIFKFSLTFSTITLFVFHLSLLIAILC